VSVRVGLWGLISDGLLAYGLLKWASNARNLIGIRKDLLEMEKAKMDLADHRSRIQPATVQDVKRYDPKVMRLEEKIGKKLPPLSVPVSTREAIISIATFVVLLIAMIVLWFFIKGQSIHYTR
jgi:hypothetical protein